MVLVDTNIIIDLWKNRSDDIIQLFEKESVCICGVIRSELMHGAYSEKNLEDISQKLNYITEINLENKEWDAFGRFLYKLRTNGLSVPYADAVIAFIAITNNLQLLTRDKHFRLIQVVESKLKFYKDGI